MLRELGADTRRTTLPDGTMHLMGQVRYADRDLALVWSQRLDPSTAPILEEHGFTVLPIPSEDEAIGGYALNLVTLGPRSVIMAAGNPLTQACLEDAGIDCTTVDVSELIRGAGGIACMTGVLERAG